MTPPTLEEVIARAKEIGLVEIEAQKFWHFYESKGWCVGKSPMAQWRSSLAGWKLRCDQCAAHAPGLSNVDKILRKADLDRIEARMSALRRSYGDHQTWDERDREEMKRLKPRRLELMKLLGMTV